jgi:hypothetical protein
MIMILVHVIISLFEEEEEPQYFPYTVKPVLRGQFFLQKIGLIIGSFHVTFSMIEQQKR